MTLFHVFDGTDGLTIDDEGEDDDFFYVVRADTLLYLFICIATEFQGNYFYFLSIENIYSTYWEIN